MDSQTARQTMNENKICSSRSKISIDTINVFIWKTTGLGGSKSWKKVHINAPMFVIHGFMPINVTFVCQFLAMDSENDLWF